MSSKADGIVNDEMYRRQVHKHFLNCVKNPPLQKKIMDYTKQSLKDQQKLYDYEASLKEKKRNVHQTPMSGGDADRMLYSKHATQHDEVSCRMCNTNGLKDLQSNSKLSTPSLTSNSIRSSRKYQRVGVDDMTCDNPYMYEKDSNLGQYQIGSEGSAKSQKSFQTIVSRKSSHDLRKMVASQCKLHEIIDETINQMTNTDVENTVENNACSLQDQRFAQYPLTSSQCKQCTNRMHAASSQKNVTAQISKGDVLDCRNATTLSITVNDVINAKVINPMINKLHRLYINNLKEEMSLLEDLERVPSKVNEVYNSIIFKQKN